jgi:tRNA-splicing ligase RtcB (3'-phosphate/5'-hydroxy nucleic acid ligase)
MIEKPHTIYAEVLEDTALEQFQSAMAQPFAVRGALMPDAHTGYSLPIGAVVATDNYVVPAWVGYDIGCGMCALKLDGVDVADIDVHSKEIFDEIYERIPVGFNANKESAMSSVHRSYFNNEFTFAGHTIFNERKGHLAVGSLGGGNHFIEIGHDENDEVWVVIHSGSRGVGHAIATHYMKLAHPEGKAKEGHHGFAADSKEGRAYIQDLNTALEFALLNRRTMMERVVDAITHCLNMSCYELDFSGLINRNHNHATERNGLWIHRKGATHAEEGMLGVIPGNMRDGSFIVRGKGNPDALYSSSHGAGRVMGRKQAKRELKLEDFKQTMEDVQALVTEKTLDESPSAYKDIFEVMRLQEGLVEVLHHIQPMINIKG